MHVCRKYSSKSYSPYGYGDKKSDEFTFPAKCGSYVKVSDMQRLHCSSIVEAFVHGTAGYSDPEGARTVWCVRETCCWLPLTRVSCGLLQLYLQDPKLYNKDGGVVSRAAHVHTPAVYLFPPCMSHTADQSPRHTLCRKIKLRCPSRVAVRAWLHAVRAGMIGKPCCCRSSRTTPARQSATPRGLATPAVRTRCRTLTTQLPLCTVSGIPPCCADLTRAASSKDMRSCDMQR